MNRHGRQDNPALARVADHTTCNRGGGDDRMSSSSRKLYVCAFSKGGPSWT